MGESGLSVTGKSPNDLPEGEGGKGGIAPVTRSSNLKPGTECKLIRAAIRHRWKIPDQLREDIPNEMARIIQQSDVPDRDKVAAAKVVVAMESQNQADDHLQEKNDRLDSGKPTESVQFKAFLGVDPDKV